MLFRKPHDCLSVSAAWTVIISDVVCKQVIISLPGRPSVSWTFAYHRSRQVTISAEVPMAGECHRRRQVLIIAVGRWLSAPWTVNYPCCRQVIISVIDRWFSAADTVLISVIGRCLPAPKAGDNQWRRQMKMVIISAAGRWLSAP